MEPVVCSDAEGLRPIGEREQGACDGGENRKLIAGVSGPTPAGLIATPASFDFYTERYYNQYRIVNCKETEGNNCRVLQHSNGLCVLCVDPSHRALQPRPTAPRPDQRGEGVAGIVAVSTDPPATLKSVSFGSGRGNCRLDPEKINVVGKRKKNALICQAEMTLCTLEMTDGTQFRIPACVDGTIIELNPCITSRPDLLRDAPTCEGYIAVINPHQKFTFDRFELVSHSTGGDALAGGGEEE